MKSFAKLLVVLMLISSIFVFSGCGSKSEGVVPDGSTITVGPDFKQTGIASWEVPVPFTVVVRYKDGSPIPKAKVNVAGHYAASSTFAGLYQFFLYADPTSSTNVKTNSPFDVITDDFGTYTFSALISAGMGSFTDTINVRSGTAMNSAIIEVK